MTIRVFGICSGAALERPTRSAAMARATRELLSGHTRNRTRTARTARRHTNMIIHGMIRIVGDPAGLARTLNALGTIRNVLGSVRLSHLKRLGIYSQPFSQWLVWWYIFMKLNKTLYKHSLSFDNSYKSDYIWIEDTRKLELLTDLERKQQISRLEHYGYILGQAKDNENPELVGVYHKLLKDLPIDETLTPENAEQRGYEFLGDTSYDREAPLAVMKSIIDSVEKKGYKLGQPASTMAADIYQGLYAPLKK